MVFLNRSFDKKRLKALLLWFRLNLSEGAALKAVEILQGLGFRSATQGAISLGLDDLKTPASKGGRVFQAQLEVALAHHEHHRGNRTPVELFQNLVDTWHRTSQDLTAEVVQLFHSTERVNPVYMMAFSGARGNISQVRQLVGMRGLMADPRGQIVGFPILSNFREGLTITEYFVSCYGARKGVVDTAIRTADAGYLTRRLADVSHHVVVRTTNCGTHRNIRLRNIKEGQKTILSLSSRLVGRVLAETPGKFASRNEEITPDLASKLASEYSEISVRSPLSCSLRWGVCQLCYGWGLSEGRRVTLGEAVGIIAAQSIGEPGTQLTLRTFHTGGVFSGDLLDEIRAPYAGTILFPEPLQGLLVRTPHGQIAFLAKVSGKMIISPAFTSTHVEVNASGDRANANLSGTKLSNDSSESIAPLAFPERRLPMKVNNALYPYPHPQLSVETVDSPLSGTSGFSPEGTANTFPKGTVDGVNTTANNGIYFVNSALRGESFRGFGIEKDIRAINQSKPMDLYYNNEVDRGKETCTALTLTHFSRVLEAVMVANDNDSKNSTKKFLSYDEVTSLSASAIQSMKKLIPERGKTKVNPEQSQRHYSQSEYESDSIDSPLNDTVDEVNTFPKGTVNNVFGLAFPEKGLQSVPLGTIHKVNTKVLAVPSGEKLIVPFREPDLLTKLIGQTSKQAQEFLLQPSTVIFVRQKEQVCQNQLLAEFSSSNLKPTNDQIEVTQQVLSEAAGQVWFKEIHYGNRKGPGSGSLGTHFSSQNLGAIWVLAGKPMSTVSAFNARRLFPLNFRLGSYDEIASPMGPAFKGETIAASYIHRAVELPTETVPPKAAFASQKSTRTESVEQGFFQSSSQSAQKLKTSFLNALLTQSIGNSVIDLWSMKGYKKFFTKNCLQRNLVPFKALLTQSIRKNRIEENILKSYKNSIIKLEHDYHFLKYNYSLGYSQFIGCSNFLWNVNNFVKVNAVIGQRPMKRVDSPLKGKVNSAFRGPRQCICLKNIALIPETKFARVGIHPNHKNQLSFSNFQTGLGTCLQKSKDERVVDKALGAKVNCFPLSGTRFIDQVVPFRRERPEAEQLKSDQHMAQAKVIKSWQGGYGFRKGFRQSLYCVNSLEFVSTSNSSESTIHKVNRKASPVGVEIVPFINSNQESICKNNLALGNILKFHKGTMGTADKAHLLLGTRIARKTPVDTPVIWWLPREWKTTPGMLLKEPLFSNKDKTKGQSFWLSRSLPRDPYPFTARGSGAKDTVDSAAQASVAWEGTVNRNSAVENSHIKSVQKFQKATNCKNFAKVVTKLLRAADLSWRKCSVTNRGIFSPLQQNYTFESFTTLMCQGWSTSHSDPLKMAEQPSWSSKIDQRNVLTSSIVPIREKLAQPGLPLIQGTIDEVNRTVNTIGSTPSVSLPILWTQTKDTLAKQKINQLLTINPFWQALSLTDYPNQVPIDSFLYGTIDSAAPVPVPTGKGKQVLKGTVNRKVNKSFPLNINYPFNSNGSEKYSDELTTSVSSHGPLVHERGKKAQGQRHFYPYKASPLERKEAKSQWDRAVQDSLRSFPSGGSDGSLNKSIGKKSMGQGENFVNNPVNFPVKPRDFSKVTFDYICRCPTHGKKKGKNQIVSMHKPIWLSVHISSNNYNEVTTKMKKPFGLVVNGFSLKGTAIETLHGPKVHDWGLQSLDFTLPFSGKIVSTNKIWQMRNILKIGAKKRRIERNDGTLDQHVVHTFHLPIVPFPYIIQPHCESIDFVQNAFLEAIPGKSVFRAQGTVGSPFRESVDSPLLLSPLGDHASTVDSPVPASTEKGKEKQALKGTVNTFPKGTVNSAIKGTVTSKAVCRDAEIAQSMVKSDNDRWTFVTRNLGTKMTTSLQLSQTHRGKKSMESPIIHSNADVKESPDLLTSLSSKGDCWSFPFRGPAVTLLSTSLNIENECEQPETNVFFTPQLRNPYGLLPLRTFTPQQCQKESRLVGLVPSYATFPQGGPGKQIKSKATGELSMGWGGSTLQGLPSRDPKLKSESPNLLTKSIELSLPLRGQGSIGHLFDKSLVPRDSSQVVTSYHSNCGTPVQGNLLPLIRQSLWEENCNKSSVVDKLNCLAQLSTNSNTALLHCIDSPLNGTVDSSLKGLLSRRDCRVNTFPKGTVNSAVPTGKQASVAWEGTVNTTVNSASVGGSAFFINKFIALSLPLRGQKSIHFNRSRNEIVNSIALWAKPTSGVTNLEKSMVNLRALDLEFVISLPIRTIINLQGRYTSAHLKLPNNAVAFTSTFVNEGTVDGSTLVTRKKCNSLHKNDKLNKICTRIRKDRPRIGQTLALIGSSPFVDYPLGERSTTGTANDTINGKTLNFTLHPLYGDFRRFSQTKFGVMPHVGTFLSFKSRFIPSSCTSLTTFAKRVPEKNCSSLQEIPHTSCFRLIRRIMEYPVEHSTSICNPWVTNKNRRKKLQYSPFSTGLPNELIGEKFYKLYLLEPPRGPLKGTAKRKNVDKALLAVIGQRPMKPQRGLPIENFLTVKNTIFVGKKKFTNFSYPIYLNWYVCELMEVQSFATLEELTARFFKLLQTWKCLHYTEFKNLMTKPLTTSMESAHNFVLGQAFSHFKTQNGEADPLNSIIDFFIDSSLLLSPLGDHAGTVDSRVDSPLKGKVNSAFRHLSPFGGKQSEYESVDSLPLRGTNSAIKGTVNSAIKGAANRKDSSPLSGETNPKDKLAFVARFINQVNRFSRSRKNELNLPGAPPQVRKSSLSKPLLSESDQITFAADEFLDCKPDSDLMRVSTWPTNESVKFSNFFAHFQGKKTQVHNTFNIFPGQLIAYGETIGGNNVTTESGQVLYVDSQRTTIRKAQTVLIYSQAIIAVLSGEWIKKGTPLMALSYQKLVTGDIVQGLPKIEQFFEAPVLKDGTFWSDSLQAKLNQFFQEHREQLPLAEAVRKGFSEIQRVLIEGVQRVYISQGVLIADKHLEVIVRQMTCKGRILYSGDTGFLRNELVSLDKIESVNQVTYGQKALYHPQVRGITDASLESESFLSAASFQETTRVLSRDAIIGKTDLMRGLKERVIVGELIQAGTGLANNNIYNLL